MRFETCLFTSCCLFAAIVIGWMAYLDWKYRLALGLIGITFLVAILIYLGDGILRSLRQGGVKSGAKPSATPGRDEP